MTDLIHQLRMRRRQVSDLIQGAAHSTTSNSTAKSKAMLQHKT